MLWQFSPTWAQGPLSGSRTLSPAGSLSRRGYAGKLTIRCTFHDPETQKLSGKRKRPSLSVVSHPYVIVISNKSTQLLQNGTARSRRTIVKRRRLA